MTDIWITFAYSIIFAFLRMIPKMTTSSHKILFNPEICEDTLNCRNRIMPSNLLTVMFIFVMIFIHLRGEAMSNKSILKLQYFSTHTCTSFNNEKLYSYSGASSFSGITHDATAFVGCDSGKVSLLYALRAVITLHLYMKN